MSTGLRDQTQIPAAKNPHEARVLTMAIYTKHGQRITGESVRIDPSCYFADKILRIRVVPEKGKREQVYWVKDLLADDGKQEIEAFIKTLTCK